MSSLLSSFAAALGLGGASADSVDVATLHQRLEAGEVPVLVDVRTVAEFRGGHVPAAINVPLAELGSSGALEPYRGQDLYVICQSGARSARAQSVLAGQGFTAINVRGGTGGWRRAGYEVSTAR